VTSVSKSEEQLSGAAAAIAVVTNEELRRSGAHVDTPAPLIRYPTCVMIVRYFPVVRSIVRTVEFCSNVSGSATVAKI